MTAPRICHEIVIDKDAGEVRLNGLPFPFYVDEYIQVDGTGRHEVAAVGLSVLADNVTIIDQGRTTRPVVATHATEIVWARDEGRRIVRRGLADVDPEQVRARERAPIFEAVVADRTSRPVTSSALSMPAWQLGDPLPYGEHDDERMQP